MKTKKSMSEFRNLIPVFEVELTRQREIPISVGTTGSAVEVLHAMLDKSPVEQMVVLYLDSASNVIGAEKVGIGSVGSVQFSFCTLMRGAIIAGVENIIVGHNHTFDSVYPSGEDLHMTGMALIFGAMIGIKVRDHIIISPDGTHYSMYDNRHRIGLFSRDNQNRVMDLLGQVLEKNLII